MRYWKQHQRSPSSAQVQPPVKMQAGSPPLGGSNIRVRKNWPVRRGGRLGAPPRTWHCLTPWTWYAWPTSSCWTLPIRKTGNGRISLLLLASLGESYTSCTNCSQINFSLPGAFYAMMRHYRPSRQLFRFPRAAHVGMHPCPLDVLQEDFEQPFRCLTNAIMISS